MSTQTDKSYFVKEMWASNGMTKVILWPIANIILLWHTHKAIHSYGIHACIVCMYVHVHLVCMHCVVFACVVYVYVCVGVQGAACAWGQSTGFFMLRNVNRHPNRIYMWLNACHTCISEHPWVCFKRVGHALSLVNFLIECGLMPMNFSKHYTRLRQLIIPYLGNL